MNPVEFKQETPNTSHLQCASQEQPAPCAHTPSLQRMQKIHALGMTLIEVMIVIAIIGLITGGIAVVVFPRFRKAQVESTKMEAQKLYGAVQTWKINHSSSNECPTVQELKNSQEVPATQNVNDTWGTPYKIVCGTDDFGVMSAGPDKKENTEDDIWAGSKPSGQ